MVGSFSLAPFNGKIGARSIFDFIGVLLDSRWSKLLRGQRKHRVQSLHPAPVPRDQDALAVVSLLRFLVSRSRWIPVRLLFVLYSLLLLRALLLDSLCLLLVPLFNLLRLLLMLLLDLLTSCFVGALLRQLLVLLVLFLLQFLVLLGLRLPGWLTACPESLIPTAVRTNNVWPFSNSNSCPISIRGRCVLGAFAGSSHLW